MESTCNTPPRQKEADHETLARLRPLQRAVGITRVADVTWLDYIGMPVFQAIRPRSRSYVVSQGKGLTREQAEISAIMESLELFHAEEVPCNEVASIAAMASQLSYDPEDLQRVSNAPLDKHLIIPWVRARNLVTGAEDYVPRDLVSTDYVVGTKLYAFPFRRTTNGLATGVAPASATLHGLYEVIERDCLSRSPQAVLDTKRLPPSADVLKKMIERAGICLSVYALSNVLELPCFKASIHEPGTGLTFSGAACHSDRTHALIGAMTEVVQSRLTVLTGSRDDLKVTYYGTFARDIALKAVKQSGKLQSINAVPTYDFSSAYDEFNWLVDRLKQRLDAEPIVVDLTRPDLRVPVCFIAVPKLSFSVRLH